MPALRKAKPNRDSVQIKETKDRLIALTTEQSTPKCGDGALGIPVLSLKKNTNTNY